MLPLRLKALDGSVMQALYNHTKNKTRIACAQSAHMVRRRVAFLVLEEQVGKQVAVPVISAGNTTKPTRVSIGRCLLENSCIPLACRWETEERL